MSEANANYVRGTYILCNYWYAVSVEQDIHVDFDHVPEKINGMLSGSGREKSLVKGL